MAGQYVEVIEEELIPEATSRYLGFFDDMGDYGDEMFDGPEDDEDEDGDEPEEKPKPKKGKKKGDNAATDAGDADAGDGEKKECK
jgi:hypothetical protein